MNPDKFEMIGRNLDAALQRKDGRRKSDQIAALAVQVSRWLGLQGPPSDDPHRAELVNVLWSLSDVFDGSRPWDATREYRKLPGYIAEAATSLLAIGLEAKILARDPSFITRPVLAAAQANRLPVSITDIQDTVREMTRFGPISDRILPEEVAEQRILMHQRLLSLLRSPEAADFLRQIGCRPDASASLCGQLRTPEEQALLREKIRELRNR